MLKNFVKIVLINKFGILQRISVCKSGDLLTLFKIYLNSALRNRMWINVDSINIVEKLRGDQGYGGGLTD
jgi:hypothetical protein